MRVSTRARYGLRLMVDLAVKHGKGPILLRDVSRDQEISEKYLSQIIIPLKTAGLVKSFRGAHGGYTLQRDPAAISLFEIVTALEGDLGLVECVTAPSTCNRTVPARARRLARSARIASSARTRPSFRVRRALMPWRSQASSGFISVVGSQNCSGATCGFVATTTKTWSTVKGMYG